MPAILTILGDEKAITFMKDSFDQASLSGDITDGSAFDIPSLPLYNAYLTPSLTRRIRSRS
jgi:hypothetical protein